MKIATVALATLIMSLQVSQGQAAAQDAVASENSCRSYGRDIKHSESHFLNTQKCCDLIFENAPIATRKSLSIGSLQFDVAADWGIVCVDQKRTGKNEAKVPKVRRVYSGQQTFLRDITVLEFAPTTGKSADRPILYVASHSSSQDQELILGFPYFLLNGDIIPDRKMTFEGQARTVSMTKDPVTESLFLLGADSKIRVVNMFYDDRLPKKEMTPKVDQIIELGSSKASPLAIVYSPKLKKIFILNSDREIFSVPRLGGVPTLESSLSVDELTQPNQLAMDENSNVNAVKLRVIGQGGAEVQLVFEISQPVVQASPVPEL